MRVLVLNASYVPYDVWSWKKVFKKLHSENPTIFVINEYKDVIRDGSGNEYNVPAVVVLNRYHDKHDKLAPYSKMNVYARDMQVCQYCAHQFPIRLLTLDHVIPKSHWNPRRFSFNCSSFENVVACCRDCNTKKRNRTPQQAGMQLLRKPRKISQAQAYRYKLHMGVIPEQWNEYLLKDEEYERILQEKESAKTQIP